MAEVDALKARLAALQKLYVQKLPEKRALLSAALLAWVESPEPSGLLSLRELAHKLKGSGATYGFADISQAAAALEQRVLELLSSDAPITSPKDTLQAESSALFDAIDAAIKARA